MAGKFYILSPERQPIKELKYRISTKVEQRIFSQELPMNSEQKADEMHVSPRYCQAHCKVLAGLSEVVLIVLKGFGSVCKQHSFTKVCCHVWPCVPL